MTVYSLYNEKWTTGCYQPHVVAYYFREWRNYHMAFHKHDRVEIMYVIKGQCSVETIENIFHMTKGDFILLDANVLHRLLVDAENLCRMLNIEFVFKDKQNPCPSMAELRSAIPSFDKFLHAAAQYVLLKDTDDIYNALKSLILELDKNQQDGIMVHLLLSQIIIRISRLAEEETCYHASPTSAYIRKALSFMHQHYDKDIQIEDIAKNLNIHPSYFHRIFKGHTGLTPIEYLTRLRLEKAKMLLARTDIPIIEISGYIGINSRQYFTFLFKKYTGTTPSRYRNSINKSHHLK
jgi:AraC-like DNA-binding protein